jgi:hypothetical protein
MGSVWCRGIICAFFNYAQLFETKAADIKITSPVISEELPL